MLTNMGCFILGLSIRNCFTALQAMNVLGYRKAGTGCNRHPIGALQPSLPLKLFNQHIRFGLIV